MNTGSCTPSIPFRSIIQLIQSVLPQLGFSFYGHQGIRADFSVGQITSDAGLLPLRAFDERHHLSHDWAALLRDGRQEDRVRHDSRALLRQRLYQIVAGYEDATTPIVCVTICCCKSWPMRNWAMLWVRSRRSAVGKTPPVLAILCT